MSIEVINQDSVLKGALELAREAKTRILITSPWITERAARLLLEETLPRVRSGTLDVRIVCRVKEPGDLRITDLDALGRLNEAGCHVRYSTRLHAKLLIVDRRASIVSSANLTTTAGYGLEISAGWRNEEVGILIRDEGQVLEDLESQFSAIWEAATAIQPDPAREGGYWQPLWRGTVSFGLVTIPVRLYPAVQVRALRFHQLHATDRAPIRYRRVCSACHEEVPSWEIIRGFACGRDRYLLFTSEELKEPPPEFKAIHVVSFVPLSEIDPMYFRRSYYVAPEPAGLKAYRLLEQALGESGRVAIAKVILEKEHLATLRARRGILVLETMYWPDEVRPPEFEGLRKVEILEQELALAGTVIDNLSEAFDPTRFVDTCRHRLEEAARARIEGQQIPVAPASSPTRDLLGALRASVEATA